MRGVISVQDDCQHHERRLVSEITRVLEIMGHVRDRREGLNEADTKAAFIDRILSALGWKPR